MSAQPIATIPSAFPAPQGRSLSAANVREHVNLIQEVMGAVMKKDVHYGVIPGCKLPSLYKAGSEVLLTTFRIAVSVRAEDLSTPDCVRYRVTVTGTHQASGVVVGEGIGECSSDEDKYKWRKATGETEFNATPESRRRIKYGRDYSTKQVRTEPADVANTVLKMAKKRAQVDMTLTATAASDCFAQDYEDLPEELRETHAEPEPVASAMDPAFADWRAKVDECKTPEDFAAAWKEMTPPVRKVMADYVKQKKAQAIVSSAPPAATEAAPE